MATHDEGYIHESSAQVDTAPGVPVDRVRWGPVLAGTFAALTALVVLSVLGTAIGLSAYDPGDSARAFGIGAGIWGLISMILAFGLGGWLTARSVAVRGGDNGMLNGFLVAAVGIPLMLFLLGGAATLLGHAALAENRGSSAMAPGMMDRATPAGAMMGGSHDGTSAADQATSGNNRDDARRAGRNTAWTTLAALVLTIGAASLAGYAGARDDRAVVVHRHPADRGPDVIP